MEVHEEEKEEELVMGSKDNNNYTKKLTTMTIKGKRTKRRQRLPSPPSLTMPSPSTAKPKAQVQAQERDPAHSTDNSVSESNGISGSAASPTNSVNEFTRVSTLVEQDTANCLILLAQTPRQAQQQQLSQPGFYANYQCKTCERCFPSFQALGGHRASHKRPKPIPAALKHHMNNVLPMDNDQQARFDHNSTITNTTLSLQIPSTSSTRSVFNTSNNINKSTKVHECSICGAEFGSGQALGGHMRRHRTILLPMATSPTPPPKDQESNRKPRNILSLDLNLPAPDDQESKFPFALKDQVIVLSASALVDCHTS